MAKRKRTVTKKKKVRIDQTGRVYIQTTFNNTLVTITNGDGDVISWSSSGKMGFRGAKKNTPYAAQTAATDAAKVAYELGMRRAHVYVKGPGSGRDAAVRAIYNAGIELVSLTDITPVPHNGCRPRKKRRV